MCPPFPLFTSLFSALIGAAAFAFGPRRAYAAGLTKDLMKDQPTLVSGPVGVVNGREGA